MAARVVEQIPARNETDESELTVDSSSEEELESYNLRTAMDAWNQITELTREITSSLMAKQASILCKRCRQLDFSSDQTSNKKRRISRSSEENRKESSASPIQSVVIESPRAVTSDEESTTDMEEPHLPEILSAEVERMGRMSKLIMEIEHCQAQLRREMLAMDNDY